MEETLAVADQVHAASQRIDDGEQVSGAAAQRFLAGVRTFKQVFRGSSLTTKQMAAIRRDPALRIYDNADRALACVYDHSRALCHPDRERREDTTRTPDLSRCVDNCANGARTDEHARIIEREVADLGEEIDSPLTPEPIRDRLIERAARRRSDLEQHYALRIGKLTENALT